MMEISPEELVKLKQAAALLLEAEERLPVLKTVSWNRSLSDEFFAKGEKELPRPVYHRIDPEPSLERIGAARKLVDGESPVHTWLNRLAGVFEQTAAMMSAVGTKDFYKHSLELYGGPQSPVAGRHGAVLALANRLDQTLADFDMGQHNFIKPEKISAQKLKQLLDEELPKHFGTYSPQVIVTHEVSGKAAAGRDYIKLREDASFSDLDVTQLLQHEALVHIATNFNGQSQSKFPLLGEGHPGNSRTQEGLAVFAEFISGALDPSRLKRLSDRVIAIDMAEKGANFIEIYKFFREQDPSDRRFEAFESARRVVRGGMVEGGAPFTKDAIYLGGLLEVHNYLRTAVRTRDATYIRLLFVGKIDLVDLDAMKMLLANKLIDEPRFVPPWVSDMRHLLSYLAYSTFLNEIDLGRVASQYDELFHGDDAVK